MAFEITVSQSSFGIINYNGALAATYDANNALITSFNAANPGQTIVIWGSGVGGDPANDDRLFPQKTNNLVNGRRSWPRWIVGNEIGPLVTTPKNGLGTIVCNDAPRLR